MRAVRDVQGSLLPDLAPEKPVGPVLPSVFRGSNADLIAAVAPVYLTGSVLDVTYGEGKWWDRFTPDPFTFHDLHKVDGVDFRHLPEPDCSVDTVVFDPPYVTSGTVGLNDGATAFRGKYGIDVETDYGGEDDLRDLIICGLTEAARVARVFVLVKCMEFVSSRQFHDMPFEIKHTALGLGLATHDVIVHHTGSGPGGHNIFRVIRARRHHSYLLVFSKAAA